MASLVVERNQRAIAIKSENIPLNGRLSTQLKLAKVTALFL